MLAIPTYSAFIDLSERLGCRRSNGSCIMLAYRIAHLDGQERSFSNVIRRKYRTAAPGRSGKTVKTLGGTGLILLIALLRIAFFCQLYVQLLAAGIISLESFFISDSRLWVMVL